MTCCRAWGSAAHKQHTETRQVDQALRRQQVGSQKPADRQVAGRWAGRQAGSGQRGDSRGHAEKKEEGVGKGSAESAI